MTNPKFELHVKKSKQKPIFTLCTTFRNDMQKLLLLSCVLSLFVTAAMASAWVYYSPQDNSFQVEFPKKPKVTTSEQQSSYGLLSVHAATVQQRQSNNVVTFNITYSEYPEGTVTSDNARAAKSALDGAVQGIGQSGLVSLRSVEEIEIQGFPGRFSFFVNDKDGDVIIVKNILVNNRLYALQVQVKSGHEQHAKVTRFLESFQLFVN